MILHATLRDFVAFNAKLGFSRFLSGIDYERCLEFPAAYNNLLLQGSEKVLDLGSGARSIFPLFLAYHTNCEVFATDIGDYVFKQEKLGRGIPEIAAKIKSKQFIVEIQDATKLSYANSFFDRVSAISTLEHFPDDGDTRAMKEIARVLKPRGIAVITCPYIYNGYKEQFLKRKVYTTEYENKPVFFSRYYDDEQLEKRLISPSGLSLKHVEYYGEKTVKFYHSVWCRCVPFRNTLKYAVGFLFPVFVKLFCSQLSESERQHAQVAVLRLDKSG